MESNHPADAINFFPPVMSRSGFWNLKDTEGLYEEVAKSATGSENRKEIIILAMAMKIIRVLKREVIRYTVPEFQ